jgi:fructokinase
MGVGELLWDLLPSGPQLGGAPANFAYHAHALGATSLVVSRIGDDERGREILQRFHEIELSAQGLQIDPDAPTGTASVAIDANGLAHFLIQENVAWDCLAVTSDALAAASRADAICFGSLAQRSKRGREAVQTLVTATPRNALRIFDINLRQHYYSRELIEESLHLSNTLKLNEEELETLAGIFALTGPAKIQIEKLAAQFEQEIIALTRGAGGSLLYQGGKWSDYRSSTVPIVDTVGAGDSFTAALVLGVLNKIDLDRTNAIANDLASYVCSYPGATPPIPVKFVERFRLARKMNASKPECP